MGDRSDARVTSKISKTDWGQENSRQDGLARYGARVSERDGPRHGHAIRRAGSIGGRYARGGALIHVRRAAWAERGRLPRWWPMAR